MTFRVYGVPVGQGSMRERTVKRRKLGARTRFVVHDRGAALHVWRENIAATARGAGVMVHGSESRQTAYVVGLSFWLPRTGPGAEWPKPTYKRDLDKHIRAVLDALRGIAWTDDGQVVGLLGVGKEWATVMAPPGVTVTIERA